MQQGLKSVDEAANELGISVHTVRAWVSMRKITFVKMGRRVMFKPDDLDSFINNNRVEARLPKGGLN